MALMRITSPHTHGPMQTSVVMQSVLLATVPGVLVRTYFFGFGTLVNILWGCVLALAFESLALILRGRPVAFYLKDYSALVTATLLCIALPPYAPWWLIAVGIASAILLKPTGAQATLIAEALVVANVFGAVTGYRLHVLKRGEYLRLVKERRLSEELRTLNIDLEALATTDSLTGISNRRHFFALATDEMARSKRYERPFSVLMIDIDEFKHVNDRHGHAMGDAVLRAVVQACITTLRETDIFGRFGGDEFVILLPETADGREQAERLRATVEQLRTPLRNGDDLSVTVSIGVTSACPDDKAVDDILGRADEAMYQAKASGRNQIVRG